MSLEECWSQLGKRLLLSEDEAVKQLLESQEFTSSQRLQIQSNAKSLVTECRERKQESPIVERFLHEYGLTSEEGVVLLCLVEALLRIPDERTAEELIAEKLRQGDWASHVGSSDSLFVNAGTWALILTGDWLDLGADIRDDAGGWLTRFAARTGETVTRRALLTAMNILSGSFVAGQTIEEAVAKTKWTASFDMLGEGARSFKVADDYFDSYMGALRHVADHRSTVQLGHGMSVKLTALHPRIEPLNEQSSVSSLVEKMEELCLLAAGRNIPITIDGEESERCEVGLKVVETLLKNPALRDWEGLGVVTQAYAKRAPALIDWLAELARTHRTRLNVRLVKGAYWDYEIKHAQENGLSQFPVYTRKENTDLSYLTCVGRMFSHHEHIFPQFASHNAHTIAAVQCMGQGKRYEFQRIFGMGELLHDVARRQFNDYPGCRVYVPVGNNKDLMPYLMRRLLENGANTSFVNRIFDSDLSVEQVASDPISAVESANNHSHERIELPKDIYRGERENSYGIDFGNTKLREPFRKEVSKWQRVQWNFATDGEQVRNPSDPSDVVGTHPRIDTNQVDASIEDAYEQQQNWFCEGAEVRAQRIERWADELKKNRTELIGLLQREAGKTVEDAINELREAEDFCRYYAAQGRVMFRAQDLPSPTGETNRLCIYPRGTFATISPWNFPASIFVGPAAAALVTGNTVVAKPAPQTSLVALRIASLAQEAGIGQDVFHVLPGGDEVGKQIVANPLIGGVAFTGSVAAAKAIARSLSSRDGPIVPLIAETGGVNVMVVDSSAQIEHVVDDIVLSAFKSAGQRCSALRLLCVQDEIADELLELVCGAVDALTVGNPIDWSVNVGPVIDSEAKQWLESGISQNKLIYRMKIADPPYGNYVLPTIVDASEIGSFNTEYFGPILGVHRFNKAEIDELVSSVNSLGYGLTFGIHSRIESTIAQFTQGVKTGNLYVNRSMIGAVVGTQPFGGEGLSGTGPKAGGPFYLQRFVVERVVSRNETATGGNVALMRL